MSPRCETGIELVASNPFQKGRSNRTTCFHYLHMFLYPKVYFTPYHHPTEKQVGLLRGKYSSSRRINLPGQNRGQNSRIKVLSYWVGQYMVYFALVHQIHGERPKRGFTWDAYQLKISMCQSDSFNLPTPWLFLLRDT